MAPLTLAQKILSRHAGREVAPGEITACPVSLALANDITAPLAVKAFAAMGADRVFDKDRVALVMDHFTPQKDIASAEQVCVSRDFAARMGITHYYEGGNAGRPVGCRRGRGQPYLHLRRPWRVRHGHGLHGHSLGHGSRRNLAARARVPPLRF